MSHFLTALLSNCNIVHKQVAVSQSVSPILTIKKRVSFSPDVLADGAEKQVLEQRLTDLGFEIETAKRVFLNQFSDWVKQDILNLFDLIVDCFALFPMPDEVEPMSFDALHEYVKHEVHGLVFDERGVLFSTFKRVKHALHHNLHHQLVQLGLSNDDALRTASRVVRETQTNRQRLRKIFRQRYKSEVALILPALVPIVDQFRSAYFANSTRPCLGL